MEHGRRERVPGTTFVLCLAVAFGVWNWVTPFLARHVEPLFPHAPAPRTFLRHALTFSFPTALACLAFWLLLARGGWLATPRHAFRFEPRRLGPGLVAGVVLAAGIFAIALAGSGLHPHPHLASIAGNLFSNFYEELEFRGFLYAAALASFRRHWAATLVTSILFGLSHHRGGAGAIVLTGIGGLAFGIARWRGHSVWAGWVAHQIADIAAELVGA